MLQEAKLTCKIAMCRTNVRKPGNMPICCVGTNPTRITKENRVSEETEEMTACHTTATVVWSMGAANKNQPETTESMTACYMSGHAHMRAHMAHR